MYTALYRAYRPEVFEQLLGQEHITRILKNQIASGSTSHAYLFCGTRGTGKTTTARLLAKGLNCTSDGERPCGECEACRAIRDGNFLDVVEIDAASNRGIDDIRQLRDSVNYPPAVGRNKVYIIDEVHMLSTEAFNALLKTLEEPPEYVTFILATTEPRKLPATILSRCLRLDFRRIPEPVLIKGMQQICRDVGIDVTESALRIIAANADGSVRDGLSILDQCISGGDRVVDAPQVLDFLGASGEEVFADLTDLVRKRRTAEAIEYLAQVLADGKDVRQLIRDWVSHYRNLMMTKFIRDPQSVINLSVENIDRIREQSSVMELEDINRGILELSKTADAARWSTQPRILLEVCIVNLCQGGGALPMRNAPERPAARSTVRRTSEQRGSNAGSSAESRPQAQAKAGRTPAEPAGAKIAGEEPAGAPIASAEDFAGSDDPLDRLISAEIRKRQGQQAAQPQQEGSRQPAAAKQNETPVAGRTGQADSLESQEFQPPEEFWHDGDLQPDLPPDLFDDGGQTEAFGSVSQAPAAQSEPAAEMSGDGEFDLVTLWDEVFADGEHEKGSIYLIRSNGMLTSMDGSTFTVTVNNLMTKKQTERNRRLLEDLMEARTGQRRIMNVQLRDDSRKEISVEEAAARASEVLGVEVGIE